jgi:hypothetical protein
VSKIAEPGDQVENDNENEEYRRSRKRQKTTKADKQSEMGLLLEKLRQPNSRIKWDTPSIDEKIEQREKKNEVYDSKKGFKDLERVE